MRTTNTFFGADHLCPTSDDVLRQLTDDTSGTSNLWAALLESVHPELRLCFQALPTLRQTRPINLGSVTKGEGSGH